MKNDIHFKWSILIAGILFVLGLWGCLAVYSATMIEGVPFYFAGRQLLWLLTGMIALVVCARIPFEFYSRNVMVLTVISLLALLAVLPFGVKINGMRGWYSLGYLLVQPSEIVKPFFLLALCHFALSVKSGWSRLLAMALIAAIWIVPIGLQPDFGTVAVYAAGLIMVYWLSGGAVKPLVSMAALGIISFCGVLLLKPYVWRRFEGFFNPQADPLGSGWHILQFQFAMARGGVSGMSWGKAYWANCYLPLSHSDSVFAAMTEALGMAGVIPVILLFAFLIFAFSKLALHADGAERRIFIAAFGGMTAVQALIHVSVNVTIMPPTGLTLPVLSYGGSSLLATMIGAGIAISAAAPKTGIISSWNRKSKTQKN